MNSVSVDKTTSEDNFASVSGGASDSHNPSSVIISNGTGTHPTNKKKGKKEKRSGKRHREICDVFGEAAMTNAMNISHGVQDMLYFRGFSWTEKKK